LVIENSSKESRPMKKGLGVCIASGKGGVGKSIICANLGVAISQLGFRVVVVDADIEGSSMGLIFGTDFSSPTVHDILSGSAKVGDVVLRSDGLEVVVGSVRLEALKDINIDILKNFIKDLTASYDIVLVDTPAGIGVNAVTVLSACDACLIVVTPDILSVTNALKVKVIARRLGSDVIGVVVNMVGSKYDIPSKYIEEVMGLEILGEIKEDEKVKESLLDGKPLLLHSPTSGAAVSIVRIAERLVGSPKVRGEHDS
jgi:septum site-determining protein MinD